MGRAEAAAAEKEEADNEGVSVSPAADRDEDGAGVSVECGDCVMEACRALWQFPNAPAVPVAAAYRPLPAAPLATPAMPISSSSESSRRGVCVARLATICSHSDGGGSEL